MAYHRPGSGKTTSGQINRDTTRAISSVPAGCYSPAAEEALIPTRTFDLIPTRTLERKKDSIAEALKQLGIVD